MLAPDPECVGRARRLIAAALAAAGHGEEAVEAATLLVSESLPTRSFTPAPRSGCGAGAAAEVFASRSPTSRRWSPASVTTTPTRRPDAASGWWQRWRHRGGFAPRSRQNLVVRRGRCGRRGIASWAGRRGGLCAVVRLLGTSPALVRATIEQGDALMREVALLAFGGELDDVLPTGWHLPQIDVGPILAAAEEAARAGKGHGRPRVRPGR